jgi:hypothetical protein
MTFVHPLLLGGLVLVGIPVLLHLIMRQKPKHLLFPAVRFLLQKQRVNQRKLQLRHLLLLAMRMLLIAAVCLALARPKIYSERLSLSTDRPVAAVFLFDTSFSMEYSAGGKTRLEEARRRSLELLDELAPGSRVAVLDTSDLAGSDWLSSMVAVRDLIASLELHAVNNPVSALLPAAYDLFSKIEQEEINPDELPLRFLYIFSDRTEASWDAHQQANLQRMRDRLTPPAPRALFMDVGVEQPADLAIASLELAQQVVGPSEKPAVKATVRAVGAPCDTEILCQVDGKEAVERKPVKLEAGQSAFITFEQSPLPIGFHQVRVWLASSDSLPFNNSRYATFEVRGPRQVLILTDDTRQPRIFELALTAAHAFSCEVKAIDDPAVAALTPRDLARYQAVCLFAVARPGPDLWDKLLAYVKNGGGLAIIPGGALDLGDYTSDRARKLMSGKIEKILGQDEGTPWQEETYRHPVMEPFRQWKMSGGVDFLKPGLEPRAFRYWLVKAPMENVIVSYADKQQSPALLETHLDSQSGRGRVLIFTTSLCFKDIEAGAHPKWNDYVKDSFILVLINKTIGYLAGDADEQNFNFSCGQTVPVALGGNAGPRFTLHGPGVGPSEAEARRTPDQNVVSITQAAQPGHFTLEGADGKPVAAFSLNISPEESNLGRVPAEPIETVLGPGTILTLDQKASLRDAMAGYWNQPVELLPWLMLLVLLGLAVENFLANKFYRQEPPGVNQGVPEKQGSG